MKIQAQGNKDSKTHDRDSPDRGGNGWRMFLGSSVTESGALPQRKKESPPPPLEWLPFPPLVAAVLITPKGAESPGSGRIGVIGALVFFLPI